MNLNNYIKTMQEYADNICKIVKPQGSIIVPVVHFVGNTEGWSVEIAYTNLKDKDSVLVVFDIDLYEMLKESKRFYRECSKKSLQIENKLSSLGSEYSVDFDGDTECAIYYKNDWLVDVEGEDALETLNNLFEMLKSDELKELVEDEDV